MTVCQACALAKTRRNIVPGVGRGGALLPNTSSNEPLGYDARLSGLPRAAESPS